MANGINANLVRRWVKEAEVAAEDGLGITASQPKKTKPATPAPAKFLPLQWPVPVSAPVSADIRIELHRGATAITVTWPASATGEFAAWMRELLR
ncbi:hypothetical protein SAMN05216359_1063 [Roseateles sp. YR242]|nr:hypothetical protein SAMN05216359_1063 [Roseateles sp. YR242]